MVNIVLSLEMKSLIRNSRKSKSQWLAGIFFCLIFVSCSTGKNLLKPGYTIQKAVRSHSYLAVPNITFINEENQQVTLDSLKGRVVFINFWATWCSPCRRELPTIEKLIHSYRKEKDIVFLIVDVDEPFEHAKKFIKKQEFKLPIYTTKGKIPAEFLGNAIPTTVILNKEGKRVVRVKGAGDYSSGRVRNALNKLISDS